MMRAFTLLRGRTGVLLMAALIGVGASACIPNTGPPPSTDPFQGPLYSLTNGDRAANGLPGLTFSPKLAVLAGNHACDMANQQSLFHTDLNATINSSDYSAFWTLGENILVGPAGMSPQAMESAWMNSPPHRANILSGNFNVFGMNECTSADGRVWASVDFGGLSG
jgi:uncharacterized protein YkwD